MLDLLAALLEISLEIFGEAVFQFAIEFIGTLILRGLAAEVDTSEFKNPWGQLGTCSWAE